MLSSLTSKEVTSKDEARSIAIVLPTMPAPRTAIFISPFSKTSGLQRCGKKFQKFKRFKVSEFNNPTFETPPGTLKLWNKVKDVAIFLVFSHFLRYRY